MCSRQVHKHRVAVIRNFSSLAAGNGARGGIIASIGRPMLVRPLVLLQYSVYSFRISRIVTFRAAISLPLAYSVDLSPITQSVESKALQMVRMLNEYLLRRHIPRF